jgi:hypothetical protein
VTPIAPLGAEGFDVVADSMHNAELGVAILDAMIERRGILDLSGGAAGSPGGWPATKAANPRPFVYTAFGRKGWMVPNQYWTPGRDVADGDHGQVLHVLRQRLPAAARAGRMNAERMKERADDRQPGLCRFHRGWAEEMLPEIVESLSTGSRTACRSKSPSRRAASTAATPRSSGSRSGPGSAAPSSATAPRASPEPAVPVVAHRLVDLLLGVHDERAVLRDRLAERPSRDEERPRAVLRLDHEPVR